MNRLYRIRIRPRAAWRTPWQADTLSGLLCWMCARTEGETVLRNEILNPMLAGAPPFVLSDAFPGDMFPVPLAARLRSWPAQDRKLVKRATWLSAEAFQRFRAGATLTLNDLIQAPLIRTNAQTHNMISRVSSSTGAEGSLFTAHEYCFGADDAALTGDWLSVYLRVRAGFEDRLLALFEELSITGFGADASVGKGAFGFPESQPRLEPVDHLASLPPAADGVITLSTFQPAVKDPTAGAWQSFTKFAKLGPGLGLVDVRKKPLVLTRPGACWAWSAHAVFLGRAIPMDEFLPAATTADLRDRGFEVLHPAFGLAVPCSLGRDWYDD